MKKSKQVIIGGLFAFLIAFLMPFSLAFGVVNSYWDDMPLRLAPGESKTVFLGLQNMLGGEAMTLKAEITDDGGGIATLVDTNLDYLVPLGDEIGVPIRIEVPEDAKRGVTHMITTSFTQISTGGGGMVHLTGGIVSRFPVEIVGERDSELYVQPEPKEGIPGFWFILIAITVTLIVFTLARRRKH